MTEWMDIFMDEQLDGQIRFMNYCDRYLSQRYDWMVGWIDRLMEGWIDQIYELLLQIPESEL